MNLSWITYCCASFLLTFACPSKAQFSPRLTASPRQVDLTEALELVENNNRDVQLAKTKVEQQRGRERRTIALYLPKLDFRANQTFNFPEIGFSIPGTQNGISVLINPASQFDAQLTLSQTLLSLSALASIRDSTLETERLVKEAQSVRRTAHMDVIKAYYEVIRAQHAVDISQNSLSRSRELFKRMSRKYKRGFASRAERNQGEIEVLESKRQLADARLSYESALANLDVLIGVEEGFSINPRIAVGAIEKSAAQDELLARAKTSREDLLAQKAALERARGGRQGVFSAFFPVISVAAQGYYTSNTSGFISSPFRGALVFQGAWSLYDGGERYAQLREAQAQIRLEEIKLRDMEKRIALEIRTRLLDVENKTMALESAVQKLKLQRSIFLDAQQGYKKGTLDLTQLLNATHDLTRLELGKDEAALDLDLARLDLANVAGLLHRAIQKA